MKISDLLRIDIEECEKENFKRSILVNNIRRGRILAKVIIGFEAFFAILDICALILNVYNRFYYSLYLMMYLLMIFINIVYLFFFKGLKDSKDISINQLRKLEIGLVTYLTLISSWSSLVSLMDQKIYGQLMVFMVNIIIISVLFLLDNKKRFIPYVCSVLIIFIGLPFFQSSKDVIFGHYINLCVFIFTSWLASRIVFSSYCNDFKSKALLKETNILLEREIEQNTIIHMKLTEANYQLKKLALVDELTGIPNRRSFRNYIDIAFESYVKENTILSIIMIDIDYFKQLNDNYGHNKGDRTLRAVANQISSVVRHSMEFVARWGGEEFIYVAFNTDEEEIVKIAETIRNKVLALKIPHEFSRACGFISVSLGTCSIVIQDKVDVSKGIDLADKALYLAKTSGRNCVKKYCLLKQNG
ncbi:MAG: GGDEF domain-containing protein [Desulfitobacteriaceae bacterium]